ncbi:MAG: APC family permease [Acidobacteriota bacterium]
MFKQLFRWIVGRKMATSRLADEKFNVFWGLPILASDAISSVAYAVEEMLIVLIPTVGLLAFSDVEWVAGTIILLLFILTFSYRQTVDAYPSGGGSYIVAKENINTLAGLTAGASLSVDYTLTVAVSISAGTAAITSAFPELYPYRVPISIMIILLMVVGNIRGIKESSRIFSLPTYAFVFAILALIAVGFWKHLTGQTPHVPDLGPGIKHMTEGAQAITLFLLLKAFSAGCAAVTGVEAISNAVPNFKEPSSRNAKIAYIMLAFAVFITFGGVAYLAKLCGVIPVEGQKITVLAQLAMAVFGQGTMFLIIQATTAIILAMAANTAFAGFPTLLSIMAQHGYAPRQLAMRGHRLNFSNGIVILAIMAIVLITVFQGDTHLLIPLYAIGVFTSFTLSQSGMLLHWLRLKPEGWRTKALINGLGAVVTTVAVGVIAVTKFPEGAWIVIIVVPVLVMGMRAVKRHYISVAQQLDIPNEMLGQIDLNPKYAHHVIVPIDSLNGMVIKALQYAKSLTRNVVAFHVEIMDGEADKLKSKWQMLNTDIPLVIKHSPFREIVGPLTEFIDSEEHASKPGDMITLLLPQFIVSRWWEMLFHNNTSIFIANAMFHKRNVVVSIIPFYLEHFSINNYRRTTNGTSAKNGAEKGRSAGETEEVAKLTKEPEKAPAEQKELLNEKEVKRVEKSALNPNPQPDSKDSKSDK